MLADYSHPEPQEPLGRVIYSRQEQFFIVHSDKDTEQSEGVYHSHNGNGHGRFFKESVKEKRDRDDENDDLFFAASEDDSEPNFEVDDSIALYLKEISRIPLLSGREEVQLARAIERGRGL